jgi:tetratricopeptide (TPR) repeat protein
LAEWALEQDAVAPTTEIARLLDQVEAEAGPTTLEPLPSGLDSDSRIWLWNRVAVRLAVARARTWQRIGDPAEAEAVLHAAPVADPPSVEVPYLLGVLAEADGRFDEAIAHYREALVNGDQPEAETRLGELLATGKGHAGPPRDWFLTRDGGPAFDDFTKAAGLDGVRAQRVAWGDPDGDADPDLLLDGRLFLNDGQGRFVEAVLPAGPAATGGLWADVDGDGVSDLLLTGGKRNRLLLNRGEAGWESRALPGAVHRRTEAAAFADIDTDGDLDLYLANYERGGSRRGLCNSDQLLLNDGDGSFIDASEAAGMILEKPLCGRGMAWSDVDGDGLPDAVVGNYRLDPNLLWRNLGDGRFEEAGATWGVRGDNSGGAFGHTIAVAPGDLDGDGREDLVLSNLAHPRFIEFSDRTRLLLTGAGSSPPLPDRREASRLHFAETESDAALGDVDNDGDLDLFVTAIYPGRLSRLYLNDGHGRLSDVSWLAGARVANGWGAAFADADGDGALDLLVASADGVRLLRNRGPGGHWLGVRLDDPSCNRAGVGARVTLRAAGRVQVRTVRIGRGTGSQDDVALHFGLGDHAGPVELAATNACGETFGARLPRPDSRVTLHGAH